MIAAPARLSAGEACAVCELSSTADHARNDASESRGCRVV